ncbi:MAG: glycosyltransferase [Phycisphaerales bacterium]|nr:glycosyltransferase [Phycisphaerales bacterium]
MSRPLNILVVTGAFPLASETFVREQCRGLLELGQNVEILALRPGDNQWGPRDLEVDLAAHTLVANIDRPLWARMAMMPHRFLRLGMSSPRAALRSVSPGNGWRATSGQLVEVAAALGGPRDYDVIHCEFGPMGRIAVELKAAGLITGEISTAFYGYDITREIRKHGKEIYADLYREAKVLLPNSNYLKGLLLKEGAPQDKVRLHRLGIISSDFPYVDRSGRTGSPRMLAVGRCVQKKGFEYLIRALAVAREDTDWTVRIVGDGELRPGLESLSHELGLEDRIEFVGWKTHEEVSAEMVDADLFVAPSVTADDGDMEGLPLVIAEAMATGLPVLGTVHSGIPEAVRDGENGILVAEGDVEGLAEGFRRLSDPDHRLLAGKRSREIVELDFDASKQARELLDVLSGIAR